MKKLSFPVMVLIITTIFFSCAKTENPKFVEAENQWRKERDSRMRSEKSWLTIAGLYWLNEGNNRFGTSGDNEIIFPEAADIDHAGSFRLEHGKVTFAPSSGSEISHDGSPAETMILNKDMDGKPDILSLGPLRFWVIQRENRYAIRLRNLEAKRYTEYKELHFYPARGEYRVKATLIPFDTVRTIMIPTIVGTEEAYRIPGKLEFTLHGKKLSLLPFEVESNPLKYFIIVMDETSKEETYGAGRYMYVDILPDGTVDLNFNRAYSPPCDYTPYATCPLAPQENVLDVRIEAGEKRYSLHD